MDKMTNALLEMANLDELSRMDTFLHRRHPLAKLFITIVYIFTVVSFPVDRLSGLIPMILIPVVLYQLAEIPIRTCFYKLRYVLPLVCAVGIWNPILDRRAVLQIGAVTLTAGMISFLTLLLKGILALMLSFLLIATTGIEKICYALRLIHVPEMLVTLILITYRYISLLLHEAGTMVHAYELRAPGQKGIHISAWGSFVGQLLLRSMDRAGNLFQSMELRGFHGSFAFTDTDKADRTDYVFTIVTAAVILAFRWINVSELIGALILG